MSIRSGIPRIGDVDRLVQTPLYRRYIDYNNAFLARHDKALRGYGRHWGQDPFGLWSRRYEYPYVGEKVLDFARSQPPDRDLAILDAGSGVTFFDYFLGDELPNARVVCVDYDNSYHAMFKAINDATPGSRVRFVEAPLQNLPQPDGAFDSVCCLSVLEHTDHYGQIIKEFSRVVRTGGQLVLTFDLSLDGKFPLSREQASDLLAHVSEYFTIQDIDAQSELAAMDSPGEILSTDHVRRTAPHLLPWKYPLLKGVHDLIKGHGWTGGFRSKSVFCLDARRK
jgi:SAM-dependent methyltransferase